MYKIGLIVNPLAGIGGKAALKGSDDLREIRKSIDKGYHFEAAKKVSVTLRALSSLKNELLVYTYSGAMGEDILRECGLSVEVIGQTPSVGSTREDTIRAARDMQRRQAELILFAGGDGTARDIYEAVKNSQPVLGIPCGVKIHSGVYAIHPRRAGEVIRKYLCEREHICKEAEVMDIDEKAFRQGIVRAELYGYLRVPNDQTLIQKVKSGGIRSGNQLEQLGRLFAANMKEKDTLYIVGPGSTTTYVMKALGLPFTLLGVDLVADGRLTALDVDEKKIWEEVQKYSNIKIIVTVIGGQGHLFGRGNQQISPRIIRKAGKKNIRIILDDEKLTELIPRPFLVDTGDTALDRELCGYIKVPRTSEQEIVYKISD